MFQQLIAIARNTFVESLRQPIVVVLIKAGIVLLVINAEAAAYTMENDTMMFIQIGLSILLLAGLLMACFTATGVLSLEVENKTVLTVVSKPVTRPLFILGKYLGVAGAITVGMWPLIMAFLLCARRGALQTASDPEDWPVIVFGSLALLVSIFGSLLANYLYRWKYTATFVVSSAAALTFAYLLVLMLGKDFTFQGITAEFTREDSRLPGLLVGLLLLYESLLILCAVAVAVSARLRQMMTIVVTLVFGALSVVSESLLSEAVQADTTGASFKAKLMQWVATVVYHVTPNLQFLWLADDLTVGANVSAAYVLTVTGYSALFIVAVLGIAVALFQTREVG